MSEPRFEVPRIKPEWYRYDGETTAEQERADSRAAHETLELLHGVVKRVAEGEKYAGLELDAVRANWGSRDDLHRALSTYGLAAQNLYRQDEASRRFAERNLGALIEEAGQMDESMIIEEV